jgi:hypothetical protein
VIPRITQTIPDFSFLFVSTCEPSLVNLDKPRKEKEINKAFNLDLIQMGEGHLTRGGRSPFLDKYFKFP